jgi:hypothetical protein
MFELFAITDGKWFSLFSRQPDQFRARHDGFAGRRAVFGAC